MATIGYFIVQYQMAGIHAGIQAAHCLGEMARTYLPVPEGIPPLPGMNNDSAATLFKTWLDKDKTMIILNGGTYFNLLDLKAEIEAAPQLPHGCFYESEEATHGLLTCVGVILPDTTANLLIQNVGGAQQPLIEKLSKLGLQR
jgi:hypothetical protein